MNVHILEERQHVQQWTGDWSDEVTHHGVFSSQEAAIRWLRKSRQHWGDKEPLMPLQQPGGISLSNGRYWVSVHEVDPEPVTAEQWANRIGGAIAGTDNKEHE